MSSDAAECYAKLRLDGEVYVDYLFDTMSEVDDFVAQIREKADQDGIKVAADHSFDHDPVGIWVKFEIVHGM